MSQKLKSGIITTENLLLALILIAATLLRFYDYSAFSYSNDELSALMRLRYDSFSDLVYKGFYVDGHPGGVQVFLWYWVKLFGESEVFVRLPFVVAGILSVFMVFKIGKFAFGSTSGLFASAAMAFLQFPILYSQIARPYGSGMLFSLIFLWFFLQVIAKSELPKRKLLLNLIGFVISAALCMYNHYFSFLFALILGIVGLFFIRKDRIIYYLIGGLSAGILFLPHLYITLNHLTFKGLSLWLGKPSPAFLFDHLFYVLDHSAYTIILFIVTIIILLVKFEKNEVNLTTDRNRVLVFLGFVLPVIVGYIYSVTVAPVLQDPVLIFSFPCLILLIFSVGGNAITKLKTVLLVGFLAAGVVGTIAINKYYSKQHFGEFKDIAKQSAEYSKNMNGDISIVISTNNPDYLKYYFEKIGSEVAVNYLNINDTAGLHELHRIVKKSESEYFMFAWTKTCPAENDDIIRAFFPFKTETIKYGRHSMLTIYCKKNSKPYSDDKIPICEISVFAGISDTIDNKNFIELTGEFSKAILIPVDTLKPHGNYSVEVTSTFNAENQESKAMLVLSLEQGNKSIIWRGNPLWWFINNGKTGNASTHFDFSLPSGDSLALKAYLWNPMKEIIKYSDIKMVVYENTLNSTTDNFKFKYPIKE